MCNVGLSAEAKVSGALVRQWEDVVYAGTTAANGTNQLSVEMDEAKWAVESALRPFVEAPTFGEFLLMKQVLQPFAHWVRRLATRLSRPGHGKIAVYATAPLSDSTSGDAQACYR